MKEGSQMKKSILFFSINTLIIFIVADLALAGQILLSPIAGSSVSSEHENSNIVWLNEYFPLMPNNSWTFENDLTFRVIGDEKVNGVLTKKVHRNDLNLSVFYRQDENGTTYFKEEYTDEDLYGIYTPPMIILPGNAFVGNSYFSDSTMKTYRISDESYLADEDTGYKFELLGFEDVNLSFPAMINGTPLSDFPGCLKVKVSITVPDGGDNVSFSETYWFAKGLGFVMLANEVMSIELTSATLYYESEIAGAWKGDLFDPKGGSVATVDLHIKQDGQNVTGTVLVAKRPIGEGGYYTLPIENGNVSGPTVSITALDNNRYIELAITKNGDELSGQYFSNFIGNIYGSTTATTYVSKTNHDDGAPKTGCFIATAAYGSYMESHVITLRQFRDSYLLTNKLGTKFVEVYYKYSPPMADFIAEHDALRAVARIGLAPLVGFSLLAVNYGVMVALAFLFGLLTLIIGGTCFMVKSREAN